MSGAADVGGGADAGGAADVSGAAGASGPTDPTAVTDADWQRLREAAKQASTRAYVPYSRYRVGAAALTDTGEVVTGANVENASYGLTLCAECALVSKLHTDGLGARLVAFACVDAEGAPLQPCGRCRQLLYEFGGDGLLIDGPHGTLTLGDLLPWAFGPQHLDTADTTEQP